MGNGSPILSFAMTVDAVTKATVTGGADVTGAATPNSVPHTGFALFLDKVDYGIMVPMVYIALLFCLVGIVYRIVSIFRAVSWSSRYSPGEYSVTFSLKVWSSVRVCPSRVRVVLRNDPRLSTASYPGRLTTVPKPLPTFSCSRSAMPHATSVT